jgi:hypothetical protein
VYKKEKKKMSVTTVVMNPQQELGYATFMEDPNTGASIVAVMTKRYIQRILATANAMLLANLKASGKDISGFDTIIDGNPEKIVKMSHAIFIFMGYKDRKPHTVEMVDYLYDFNEEAFQRDGDGQKAIVTYAKKYNLHLGGSTLAPWYPDAIPMPPLPGFQNMKLPQFPGLPPLPSAPL